jgi:hypothetical protein
MGILITGDDSRPIPRRTVLTMRRRAAAYSRGGCADPPGPEMSPKWPIKAARGSRTLAQSHETWQVARGCGRFIGTTTKARL